MQRFQRESRGVYGSLSPPKTSLPGDLNDCQAELIAALLDDGHFRLYPPSIEYQKTFWRHVILSIENSGNEVNQRIYDHFTEVLSMQAPLLNAFSLSPPLPSYLTYFMRRGSSIVDDDCVTLLESRTTIEAGTTGMRTWRASLMLGEWLLCNPDVVVGKHIMELGCGAGFLGILIAKIQDKYSEATSPDSQSVTMSDIDEDVLNRCRLNSELPANRLKIAPNIIRLDWCDAVSEKPEEALAHHARPDAIFGADIVYEPSLIGPLVETIWLLSTRRTGATESWIALSVRRQSTVSEFIASARSRGFIIEETDWGLPQGGMFHGAAESVHATSGDNIKLFHLRVVNNETQG